MIDLAAETPIAAEKAGRKIAIEVKSFLSPSPITNLYDAIGQYIVYRRLLRRGRGGSYSVPCGSSCRLLFAA